MKFLATVSTDIEKNIFYFKQWLYKKIYLFLNFLNQKNSQMNMCLKRRKNFLIRTGDSPKD